MKSDKLALIEVKILNLMFLVIYIPVVPTGYMLLTIRDEKLSKSLQSY